MEKLYEQMLADNPEYVSKDVMCRLCHISKKTGLYLLETGLLPSQDTGKKTHKYQIAMTDVVAFLQDRVTNPERYQAPENYYAGNGGIRVNPFRHMTGDTIRWMRQFYEKELAAYPDVLKVEDVAEFTGYAKSSVVRWCAKKRLHRYRFYSAYKIPKASLVDFLASEDFQGIRKRSRKHMDMVDRFARMLGSKK
jgi:hypothetical protein